MKKWLIVVILGCLLTSCGLPPRVSAKERLFPQVSLEFLGEYQLPKQTFAQTQVGGLSGITYDRSVNKVYAISDDRQGARFYTLSLELAGDQLKGVKLEDVTLLKNLAQEPFKPGTIDGEGIALSPTRTLFISSEGNIDRGIPPFIGEFELETGKMLTMLPIPERYLPDEPDNPPKGIYNNQGFESLTLGATSTLAEDPFRLFSAPETALKQDSSETNKNRLRFLHYGINPIGSPILVAEHLYLLDIPAPGAKFHGLVELLAFPQEGYFLSLERSQGIGGFGAKLFLVANASATDTSRVDSLADSLDALQPLQKKLLLDLGQLGIDLDNLEGMTWGPRLADGSQSLLLVSDDNFQSAQVTQFLLFRLVEK